MGGAGRAAREGDDVASNQCECGACNPGSWRISVGQCRLPVIQSCWRSDEEDNYDAIAEWYPVMPQADD